MKKHISFENKPQNEAMQMNREHGFSLMEMMAVIAIVAIISAFAAPAFTETFRRFRVSSARDNLSATINFARVEAVRSGSQVIVEKTPASGDCSASISTASDWGCGWTVYVDTNNNLTQDVSEPSIQNVTEPKGVSVTHPGGAAAVRLVVNRWGQPGTIGDRFIFFPSDQSIAALTTTTVCINTGGRMRNLAGSPVCTNT